MRYIVIKDEDEWWGYPKDCTADETPSTTHTQTRDDIVLGDKGGHMKPTGMRPIAMCAVLGVLDVCTTNGLAQSTVSAMASVETQTMPQMRASDQMFYWREEARELHAMAMHREREAELILKRKPGPATHEFVRRMHLLVHQLHQAADYAQVQAQEAEREISTAVLQELQSVLQ